MKTKVLISCAVTAQLVCVFVFASLKIWFSHDAVHLSNIGFEPKIKNQLLFSGSHIGTAMFLNTIFHLLVKMNLQLALLCQARFNHSHGLKCQLAVSVMTLMSHYIIKFEPRCEKNGLRGLRPGLTLTKLYNHRRWLGAENFGFRK